MTTSISSPNTVQIYATGGGGCNIISELAAADKEPAHGFAKMSPCYIDTSKSNLQGKDVPEDSIYLFEGMDGSGKVRSLNYDDINKNTKVILQKFKPRAFNIVVHTASGGSGSVIGPELVSELKARGQQVIVIVIGSTDTHIEINNTIKTLKSYEAIAGKRQSPIVVYYVENTKDHSRFSVNKDVKRAMSLLMGLFSGQNEELDTADLNHWLVYNKISGTKPCLTSLTFAVTKEELKNAGTVISLATLAMPEMNTGLEQKPAYQCVGYAPACWRAGAPNSLQLMGDEPIHFCISDDFILKDTIALSEGLREVNDIFNSRNARGTILERDDNITDSGTVL